MEKLNVLKDLIKIAEVLESNDKMLLANQINFTITKLAEKEKDCPDATQDIKLNLKNRQKAINEHGYGPPDPSQPNDKFWLKKMKMWKVDDLSEVKNMLCGNCAAFDITDRMYKCMEKGIQGDEKNVDAMSTISTADLGYCNFLHFKCAGSRSCKAWVTGGPITEKDKNKKAD